MKSNTDFIGEDERPKEDSLAGPLRRLDEEVLPGLLDIYQTDQHRRCLDFRAVDHVRSECKEWVESNFVFPGGGIAARYWRMLHSVDHDIGDNLCRIPW